MTRINYGRGDGIRILHGLMVQENPAAARRALEDLNLPTPTPDTSHIPLPVRSIMGMFEKAASITGNPMIGLTSGQMFRYEQFGLIGAYVMQATDLRDAFKRYVRTLRFMQTGSRLTFTETGDDVRVGMDHPDFPAIGGRHTRDYLLLVLITTARLVLGPDWRPDRIETGTRPGLWDQVIEDLFEAEVHRSENDIAIVFSRDLLGQRLSRMPGVQHVTIYDVARDQRFLPRTFAQEIVAAVDRRLRLHRTNLDDVAWEFGMSVRSLQRRLDERGLKYRQLVLQRRMQWVRELMPDAKLELAKISRQVGYGDAPQFVRAYRNLFGESAGTTRARILATRS